MMKIDKKSKHCAYNDELHCYWNTLTDSRYVSVTTMLGKYKNEFDKEFFSKYKALERIMGDEFLDLKQQVGYQNVIKVYLELNPDKEEELNEMTQVVLEEWANKTKEACERGTAYHLAKENHLKTIVKSNFEVNGEKFEGQYSYNECTEELKPGIYPELLVFDDEYNVSGQADVIVVHEDGTFDVLDFKTNAKFDTNSYFDKKTKKHKTLKFPLNAVEDCHYGIYSMQLNVYAHLIERMYGLKVNKMTLLHVDHEGNEKSYEVPLRRRETISVLKHHLKFRS